MKNIAVVGYAKSGKSTFLTTAIAEYGHVQEIMIASHLKDVCAETFNIPRDDFDNQNVKELAFETPLQIDGLDIGLILDGFAIPISDDFSVILEKHRGVKLKTPRHIAQYVGTEILREFDPDIHVKMAAKKAEGTQALFSIVTDVRFPNEYTYFKSQSNTVLIGIQRDDVAPADLSSVHLSESHIANLIPKCDYVLTNNGTRADYERKVKALLQKLQGV